MTHASNVLAAVARRGRGRGPVRVWLGLALWPGAAFSLPGLTASLQYWVKEWQLVSKVSNQNRPLFKPSTVCLVCAVYGGALHLHVVHAVAAVGVHRPPGGRGEEEVGEGARGVKVGARGGEGGKEAPLQSLFLGFA